MPTFELLLKATLEGVTEVSPMPGKTWHVKFECGSCGEDSGKLTTLCAADDKVDIPGGRGHATVVQKCKNCGRHNSADIVEGSEGTYTAEKNGELQPVLQLECRGMQPKEFAPMLEWIVRGPESSFEAADLSTGEWADYDDKADESVSILDIETACEAASGAGGKGKHRRRK